MPREAIVQSFMALVEAGDHVEAIGRYYHPDASMQENTGEPRRGRAVLMAHERKAMAGARSIVSRRMTEPLISGDHVAIRWQFDFILLDGSGFTLDEVALQRWQGDEIIEERFYYDPKQMGR